MTSAVATMSNKIKLDGLFRHRFAVIVNLFYHF